VHISASGADPARMPAGQLQLPMESLYESSIGSPRTSYAVADLQQQGHTDMGPATERTNNEVLNTRM